MVTLTEPKQSESTVKTQDGLNSQTGLLEIEDQQRPAAEKPVLITADPDAAESRTAFLTKGISGIYDWIQGPPSTKQQRIAVTLAELNERRAAQVMSFDF